MSKSEYIIELEQEAERTLKTLDLGEEKTSRLVQSFTKNILTRWRGLNIYFKLSEFNDRTTRDKAILEEHKSGKGARFLAQKYGVSQQFVYRLISKGSPDDEACTPEAARKKADNYDWVDHLNVE